LVLVVSLQTGGGNENERAIGNKHEAVVEIELEENERY
jgi:hypothetical protein